MRIISGIRVNAESGAKQDYNLLPVLIALGAGSLAASAYTAHRNRKDQKKALRRQQAEANKAKREAEVKTEYAKRGAQWSSRRARGSALVPLSFGNRNTPNIAKRNPNS